jgi:hypothetical protein
MSDPKSTGMSAKSALRLEFFIIGLGLFALVVLAGLVNNLLPLAQPGVPARSVFVVALVVAMIFCIVLLVSISAAHLYGVFFLKPPDPNTVTGKAALATPVFYMQPFVWSIAAVAAALALIITYMNKARS